MARLLLLAPALLLLLLLLVTRSLASPWALPELVGRQLEAPPPNDFTDPTLPSDFTEYDAKTWTLGSRKYIPNAYQTQPYVANGYHGSRLTAEGVGYWRIHNDTGTIWPINGWPLDNPRQTFATITGFWDSQRNTTRTNFPELLEHGGESVISGIPTWSSFVIATADGRHHYAPGIDKSEIENYHQTLSLKDGIVTTSVKWRPAKKGPAYDMVFTVVAHRNRINLGMLKVEITPCEGDSQLIVTDILDGAGAQRTEAGQKALEFHNNLIWTSVHPTGVSDVTAFVYSTVDFDFGRGAGSVVKGSRKNAEARPWVSNNASTISQEYTVKIGMGKKLTFLKYVGIASTDAFSDPAKTARDAVLEAKDSRWDELIAEHRAAWEEIWDDGDIVIPGKDVEELQISVRASLFHLLSNVRSEIEGPGIGDNSISVSGLSSDSYAGLVFWDADLWMLPSLLVLHPDYAGAINNYRYRLLPQARKNAERYSLPGALYPWTSGRFGNCTGTGPCSDYQYHLNNDIALVHWHQFLTTGDMDWFKEKGWPIIQAIAEMWSALVKVSPRDDEDGLKKGMYTVHNMTDPDEYANHVDNGAFTNVGVKVVMGIAQQAAKIVGEEAPAKWADIEEKMFIPYNTDADIIPEYAQMNGSVQIKQGDVVLINYPLEFRLNESQALHDLDFYARAQSPDGPAMTWAMFAIGALDLSPRGCASYTYFIYASQPYLRAPFYQFSEQIVDNIYANGDTNPAFTFLTGHGGLLQVPTHGFTGYRPRIDAFYLDPSIPPQLQDGIIVKGMKHHSASFDVHVSPHNTTITRRHSKKSGDNKAVTVRIGSQNEKPGDYPLLPGGTLVIPTRRPDLNGTDIPGNKAECKAAVTTSPYVPGQFPLGAVDGSNQTQWRSSTPNPSELIVDLGDLTDINALSMNWAQWPPTKWSVFASNSTGDKKHWTEVYRADHIELSEPWVEKDALKVVMRIGNTTSVVLDDDQKTSARFVRLVIEGDREGAGNGGTVAQFAIL